MPEEDVHTTKTDQLKFQDPTTRYPSISPPKQDQPEPGLDAGVRGQDPGSFTIIDLDLSKYDRIATRFARDELDERSLRRGLLTADAVAGAVP